MKYADVPKEKATTKVRAPQKIEVQVDPYVRNFRLLFYLKYVE